MLRALGLERFNPNRLKPHLKMSEQRLSIVNHKKTAQIKAQKREIAELLRIGKEEKARIRVEHLIRCDFTIEAYELLGLLCELVHERVALIANEKECPKDMEEAMCTLIWAANRAEVPELREVSRQFELKYGKEFVEQARSGQNEFVNSRVAQKLSVAPPSAKIVMNYLQAIAKEYDVDWTPAETGLDEQAMATQSMPGPTGFSVQVAPGSNLTAAYEQSPIAQVVGVAPPPLPNARDYENDADKKKDDEVESPPPPPPSLPSPPSGNKKFATSSPGTAPPSEDTHDENTDYDMLAKRFDNLRK